MTGKLVTGNEDYAGSRANTGDLLKNNGLLNRPASTTPVLFREGGARQTELGRFLNTLGRKPSLIVGRVNRTIGFIMTRILSRKRAVKIIGRNTRLLYPYASDD